jgi:hypothetical protein
LARELTGEEETCLGNYSYFIICRIIIVNTFCMQPYYTLPPPPNVQLYRPNYRYLINFPMSLSFFNPCSCKLNQLWQKNNWKKSYRWQNVLRYKLIHIFAHKGKGRIKYSKVDYFKVRIVFLTCFLVSS